jgi:hypothetical protein
MKVLDEMKEKGAIAGIQGLPVMIKIKVTKAIDP